jgi:hypothetical protein
MATKEQGASTAQPDQAGEDNSDEVGKDAGGGGGKGTFESDISETGEDGTTVRQAEVSEKELAEVKPSSDQGKGTRTGAE